MPTLSLNHLNKPQHQAVTAESGHYLVIAGAGSGKTGVLTHRIAWLIQHQNISPHAILAVTFTNKAAYEMRRRIENLLGISVHNMWVGTFHGLAHRLLRLHWEAAELPQSFQILDNDDQYRLVRRAQRNLNLDEAKWPPKQAQWFINKQKELGLRPSAIHNAETDIFTETMVKVYQTYQDICERSGLVDFSELLLRSLELLKNNPELSAHYQQRFHHILIDEFQDTNAIQYEWLKILAGDRASLMAVGDDDQSIYSWRGACIANMHRFSSEFPNTTTIRLEQNYRSTQTILKAANAVIDHNHNRLGKQLWTEGNRGSLITLYAAYNERDEAYFVVNTIREWLAKNGNPKEIAILYRSNAQSRVLEEALIEARIPYRIYGGQKFFERAEIKDALGYLRLIANRNDDAAFERVVNTPTRGIGDTTLNELRTNAREQRISLWQAGLSLLTQNQLSNRAANALQAFFNLIDTLEANTRDLTLGLQAETAIKDSGLLEHYQKDRTEKMAARVENLEEFVNAASQFTPPNDVELPPLNAFLAQIALETGEEQADANTDYISLMTLHAAKGLEFPLVMITGMEEGLFPHQMSLDEGGGLEEERRLCYVGMTRAMRNLVLTYAETRRLHGTEKFNQSSRFIAEIPDALIHAIRPRTKITRAHQETHDEFDQTEEASGLRIGQRVRHEKFGNGTITHYEGRSEHLRIQVKFDRHGSKWLIASYARLEPA